MSQQGRVHDALQHSLATVRAALVHELSVAAHMVDQDRVETLYSVKYHLAAALDAL